MPQPSDTLTYYFEKIGQLHHYQTKQIIYFQEDQSDVCFLVKKGRVRAYITYMDGREVTLDVLEAGRIFGQDAFFEETPRSCTIEAINEVELISCSFQTLIQSMQSSPMLLEKLIQSLATTTCNLAKQISRLCFLDSGQTVADFLLWKTANPNPDIGITPTTLPYTHQEVAECTNLQRVTVTRFLNQFEKNDWITLKYRQIIIKDRSALESYVQNTPL